MAPPERAPAASALPLAWFRIAFACVLAVDVAKLERDAAFWYPAGLPHTAATTGLALWLAALTALALGWRTRLAAAVNYSCAVLFLGVLGMPLGYEYHPDGLYLLASIGLLFLPVAEHLALDARRRTPRGVTRFEWAFLAFVPSSIYLDSALWKLSSEAWWNGLGFWLPAVWPTAAGGPPRWAADHELLARGLGYATLAFELLFPFLIWLRPLRVPLTLFGLGLHIGIAWLIPLPIFGALMVAFLIGLWPARAERAAPHFAGARRALPYVLAPTVAGAFALGLVEPVRALGSSGLGARRAVQDARLTPRSALHQRAVVWSYRLLGVRTHPIFIDSAFHDSTVARRLVVVAPDGAMRAAGPPVRDRHFTWWSFRATWPLLAHEAIEDRLTAYLAAFEPEALEDGARIELQRRPLELPIDGWRAGQRARNLERAWTVEATVEFGAQGPRFHWHEDAALAAH